MKINSIGINAYQQMTGRAQASQKPVPQEKTEQAQIIGKIQIPSRTDKVGSDISIKLDGKDYADMLTPEEKQALELLFEKYGAQKTGTAAVQTEQSGLGRFVDVRL